MPYAEVAPVLDERVRGLCLKPYPLHPRGCPNFGRVPRCPPRVPLVWVRYDLSRPCYVVWSRFDLGAHAQRMRALHPGWSDRQVRCCRYWQGTARKRLEAEVALFSREHAGYAVDTCPEAGGVDVTATMRLVGVELDWPPVSIVVHVALAAVEKRSTGGGIGS